MFGRLRCTCLAEHSCEEVGEGAMREVHHSRKFRLSNGHTFATNGC